MPDGPTTAAQLDYYLVVLGLTLAVGLWLRGRKRE